MMKKFLALLLILIFAVNFSEVTFAKTPEEKSAAKEAKQLKKQEKNLAKLYPQANILEVAEWAIEGDLQAKFILAYARRTGQIVKKSRKAAAELRKEISEVNADLLENFIPLEYYRKKIKLARLYGIAAGNAQIGRYVEQDFEAAIRWAQLGASENDTLSLAILGAAYYTGRGVEQDFQKAIDYSKSAKNEPIALYILADAYQNGNGVDKDLKRSFFYSNYLKMVVQPKIDKRRAKNANRRIKYL